MPLLNTTTEISAFRSVGEIQEALAGLGARQVMLEYDDERQVCAIRFSLHTRDGLRGFNLPANVDGVLAVMQRQYEAGYRRVGRPSREQARKTAWRILKDWVEAQCAIVESEMVNPDEVFLPYMLMDGGTVYQLYWNRQLALPPPGGAR